jgi:hypothetical protein
VGRMHTLHLLATALAAYRANGRSRGRSAGSDGALPLINDSGGDILGGGGDLIGGGVFSLILFFVVVLVKVDGHVD